MKAITVKNTGMRKISLQSHYLDGGFVRIEAGDSVTMEKDDDTAAMLMASVSGKTGISVSSADIEPAEAEKSGDEQSAGIPDNDDEFEEV